jgi:hypothetical protein
MRFLGVLKADKDSEAGVPPSPELMERCGAFVEEISRAGVLLATDGLHPSAKATRIQVADGKARVTDGPFAETKELIASYALLEVKSKAEAVEWTTRFLKVLGGGECVVYQVFDPAECTPVAR